MVAKEEADRGLLHLGGNSIFIWQSLGKKNPVIGPRKIQATPDAMFGRVLCRRKAGVHLWQTGHV